MALALPFWSNTPYMLVETDENGIEHWTAPDGAVLENPEAVLKGIIESFHMTPQVRSRIARQCPLNERKHMQEFIALGIGVLVGGFLGFNVGVKCIVDKAEVAAQDFIDALRDRYGSAVEREVVVGMDEEAEVVEFIELPEDLEDLGAELFNLG